MTSVGIIGMGFVGRATAQIAVPGVIELSAYDHNISDFNDNDCFSKAYNADFVFVCVPTPTSADGQLDMSIVNKVADEWFAKCSNPNSCLVIKSTVNPGFTDSLIDRLGTDRIVFNPEFFTERTYLQDFVNADEILVGGKNTGCIESILDLYRTYYHTLCSQLDCPRTYLGTTALMAEMVKISRNSFYATKISFMNELSELCDKMGIDYGKFRDVFVRQGHNAWIEDQHTYVPGPDGYRGLSGKCLPKDSMGLLRLAELNDSPMPVLKAGIEANKLRRGECYTCNSVT